jgi:ABC-type dipeptide/oligopeptide/nickel transport system permease subunit
MSLTTSMSSAYEVNRNYNNARSTLRLLTRRFVEVARKDELAVAGTIFLILVILGAIFVPVLSPYSPTAPNIRLRFQEPSLAHPLGTDDFGRDLLTRILFGARPILLAGLLSVLAATLLGTLIGTISAYRGGRFDDLMMRLMDVMLSFPAILLALLIVASLGIGLTNEIIAITFSMIPVFARLVRSIVITLVKEEYVTAARAIGASDFRIIYRTIFPNMIPTILVQATAMLAVAFSYSSALNFLGLGVEAPTPDWGLMVSEGERLVFDAPYVPFFPGLAITLTVLSVNFLGDGLRDHLDPAMRNR